MQMTVPNEILFDQVCGLLDEGREVLFRPKGNSMLPFIKEGHDSVRLRKESWDVGDAVLAKLPNSQYVLHRVFSIEGNRVTLRGDGNLAGTETCRKEDIKGKVISVVHRSGRESLTCKSSYNFKVRLWLHTPRIVKRVILAILRRCI